MFFLLSKILAFLISPSIWIIIFIICGYILKKQQMKKIFYRLALMFFLVFSNGYIFQNVISSWEEELQPLSSFENRACTVVVLGGMSAIDMSTKRVCFNAASDRLWQGLNLLQQSMVNHMVISGGSAAILYDDIPETQYLLGFLKELRLPVDSIFVEDRSRNTYENALYSKALFDSLRLEKEILLVSSAFHLPRAKRCFEKQGFKVIPVRTHFLQSLHPLNPSDALIPSFSVLDKWTLLFREWVGLITYKIKGYV